MQPPSPPHEPGAAGCGGTQSTDWSETERTIVHEAVHQLAYNSTLQRRMADNPYWVSEGLATYFESPDLNSLRGWRNIGAINTVVPAATARR